MKTPEKNQKKQGPGNNTGSKATGVDKNKNTNSGKGPWKDPDPTNPSRSPEKINEPYAGTNAAVTGAKTTKTGPATGLKKEKVTNAGESEHHIPVNKSDYENFEDEYEDFKLDEEEDEFEEEDEDGETSSHFDYEDENDESKIFRSQVKPENLKKYDQPTKGIQKELKALENKSNFQFSSRLNQKINNNFHG